MICGVSFSGGTYPSRVVLDYFWLLGGAQRATAHLQKRPNWQTHFGPNPVAFLLVCSVERKGTSSKPPPAQWPWGNKKRSISVQGCGN